MKRREEKVIKEEIKETIEKTRDLGIAGGIDVIQLELGRRQGCLYIGYPWFPSSINQSLFIVDNTSSPLMNRDPGYLMFQTRNGNRR